jgi:hypothetical protein
MSEQPKHTPGPWELQDCTHGGAILLRGLDGKRHIQSHLQIVPIEDARLIAAAPELLEALKNLENDDGSIPDHAWLMVCAAIAKAEGRGE